VYARTEAGGSQPRFRKKEGYDANRQIDSIRKTWLGMPEKKLFFSDVRKGNSSYKERRGAFLTDRGKSAGSSARNKSEKVEKPPAARRKEKKKKAAEISLRT